MLMDANIDALKRCVQNNDKAPGFNFGDWDCGTHGCLIGNDWIALGRPTSYDLYKWAENEYSLLSSVCYFLFSTIGVTYIYGARMSFRRDYYDREAAINRLRKTIAYIERKRAIMYEADGRVSELARRREGNWNVCASVLQSLGLAS